MNNELPQIVEIPMTREESAQLVESIKRYSELQGQKILTPKSDAERAGLLAHLQNTLIRHSSELVACYFAVTNEYQPLVFALRGIFNRAQLIMVPKSAIPGAAPIVDVEAEVVKND